MYCEIDVLTVIFFAYIMFMYCVCTVCKLAKITKDNKMCAINYCSHIPLVGVFGLNWCHGVRVRISRSLRLDKGHESCICISCELYKASVVCVDNTRYYIFSNKQIKIHSKTAFKTPKNPPFDVFS